MSTTLHPRLVPEKIEGLVQRATQDVEQGHLPSCQLAIALGGEVVFQTAIGDATIDTRYVIFSATKTLVASMTWRLMSEGLLDVTLPVSSYIPEFGTNGKEAITVQQVMLHTSGFPSAPLGAPEWETREGRLARFSQWRTNWEPGTKFEYHPTAAHWVLAEIIEGLRDRDYRAVIQEEILEPLGLKRFRLGVPVEEQGDIATITASGAPATPEELMATLGVSELPVTEVTEEALLGFNAPKVRSVGVPGGGGVSTAADLALFYQGILNNGVLDNDLLDNAALDNGALEHSGQMWSPDVLADVTGNIRNTFPDLLMGVPANRALGGCVAGDDPGIAAYNGFGRTTSPRAFGHNGAGGQVAWGDPETGISFAYLTNGLDANPIRQARRSTALSSRAALVTAE